MFKHKDERDADTDEPGTAPANVYQMHQKMWAIGDDFWIENGAGQRMFKVDGKALHVRKTLIFEDAAGRELYHIQAQLVTIHKVMKIERGGETVATVKKKLISPLRERYDVEMAGGDWKVQGNIVDHEYEIEGPGGPIARVGKKWFRVRDTYGVEIEPGQDDALVLAVSVVVDQIAHGGR